MILWMFVPYLLGAAGLLFYLSRFPECLLSHGTVDLCGASHQIWHVLIFAGRLTLITLAVVPKCTHFLESFFEITVPG